MHDTCRAYRTTLTIPTYTRLPDRKLPELFGARFGGNYPDTKDDLLGGPKKDVAYDAVILENRHVKLTILPELGGKLWSVYDKHAKKDSIYAPDVVKPCLVGRAGAWIPGGMEFNFPVGHHILTMRPMPVVITENTDAAAAAVIQRTCRKTGLRMEVTVSLRADEARFDIGYRVSNPTPLRHRWYQWTNVGVLVTPEWQFQARSPYYTTHWQVHPFPVDRSGRDSSWVKNRDWPSDSFMAGCREDWFGYYDHGLGIGICHVAPWQDVQGKKYFTWGSKNKVYNDRMVFSDAGHSYLEIQAGPFESQRVLKMMEPGTGREWSTTWIPYRRTGGITWADRDLVFNVDKGTPTAYSAGPMELTVTVNRRKASRKLKPGQPVRFPLTVKDGDRVRLSSGGRELKTFTFPYKGEAEPHALKRLNKDYGVPRISKPRTAAEWLAAGRRGMLGELYAHAVRAFRKALRLNPRLHEARYELADALWHTGAFEKGGRELTRLLKTPLKRKAAALLAGRKRAEKAFFATVAELTDGTVRDLALAELYAGYENSEAALKLYTRLLKREPDNWRVHYGLVRYYTAVKYDAGRIRKHAEKALALRPGDRDLLIELIPLFEQTGGLDRARELILTAPPAVRRINMVQKWLAGYHFELGEPDKAMAILGRKRIFNREGETRHMDIYFDACAARCEDALAAGRIREARQWADRLKVIPLGLGVLKRKVGNARPALWDGLVTRREQGDTAARAVWARGIRETLAEIDGLSSMVYAQMWTHFMTEELVWSLGMCGLLAQDQGLNRKAAAMIRKHADLCRMYQSWGAVTGPFADGIRAELKGDLKKAESLYCKHLATGNVNLFVARRHLAAVRKGRRRAADL